MNKVIIMGRLTRDPQYNETTNGVKTAKYSLAVDRIGSEGTDYISCTVFNKGAEFANQYLKKGTKIAVVGRIQTGSYTNKDGVKVYTTDVIVENQEFAESKKSADSSTEGQPQSQGDASQASAANNGFQPLDEAELPFN